MRKRFTTAAASMGIALALALTGCSGSGSESSSQAGGNEAAEAADTAAGDTQTEEAVTEDAEGEGNAGDIKIGLSFGTLQQEHWVKSQNIMQQVADEEGVELLVQAANDDMARQISQCENLITQGVDVLILVALDTDAATPIIQTAHEADVPVIAFQRNPQNCDVDYFCGNDLHDGGVMQAEYAVGVAPEGNYALIEGTPDDINARNLYGGQMEVLQSLVDAGTINIVMEQWCANWNANDALSYIEDAMTANNNDIQFLMTTNDAFAGAALTVLEEQGLAGQVMTTGIDCDLAACQRIVEGTQGMTVYQCYPFIADMTIRAAIQLAETGNIDEFIDGAENNGFKDVPFINGQDYLYGITADNMHIVYESGWLDVDDIYANIPEEEWPEDAKEFKANGEVVKSAQDALDEGWKDE